MATVVETSIPGYYPPPVVDGLPTNRDTRSWIPLGVIFRAVDAETGEPTGERLELVDGLLRVAV